MNYATVVSDMFSRFPKLEAVYQAEFVYMENDEPAPYIVFGGEERRLEYLKGAYAHR